MAHRNAGALMASGIRGVTFSRPPRYPAILVAERLPQGAISIPRNDREGV